ncbi:hypothetical protein [Actinoplanes sp. HUAS TT8]|uniref:hypothetical protein n=1 Tax=Actinoplanes sp. HUAS TT8 TaxID=3447453 RepID=UPI003F51D4BA
MTLTGTTPADREDLAFFELQVALGAVNSFQSATQHADGKAGTLVAVYAGLTAFVASRAGEVLPDLIGAPHGYPGLAVLAVFTAATVATGLSLLQAIRPRVTPPPGENRFAFPTVAAGFARGVPIRRADAATMTAEAWSMAGAMAVIALTKHNHVRRAVYGMTVMLVASIAAVWLLA